ncbi:hypothetical protein AVEN_188870-1 [Araneus ventricosus]|uniref:Uncharacterized protein n=1 Tax=Araneus ventricosus TaxID=182803 RepID=A0A4Y2WF70_ARAVE|nr:hypothetical protein AVEN_188870-1 [Araneus ventricosus]
MPSLFTFCAMQPPEIGAMAKITLLHRVAYKKATPSSELMSLGMKIRNRHIESCVYKNVLELQSSWNTNRTFISQGLPTTIAQRFTVNGPFIKRKRTKNAYPQKHRKLDKNYAFSEVKRKVKFGLYQV